MDVKSAVVALLLFWHPFLWAEALDTQPLDPAEISTLQVQGKPTTLLTREWQHRQHRGSAIIIPSLGDAALSPGLLEYLRQQLSLLGWTTFSLTPPALPLAPNFTTPAEEVGKAGEGQQPPVAQQVTPKRTEEEWQQLWQTQQQYLQDALGQLQSSAAAFPGKRLLIAKSESAALVLDLLVQKKLPAPDLLVLINPYASEENANRRIAKQLSAVAIPVLDVQTPDGNIAAVATQQQRRIVIDSHPQQHSRQLRLALDLRQETAFASCLETINAMGSMVTAAEPALASDATGGKPAAPTTETKAQ